MWGIWAMMTKKPSLRFAVLGAGAWGTALAQMIAMQGFRLCLWAYEKETADAINHKHENSIWLPSVRLSPLIHATNDLSALALSDYLFLVPPAQHLRRLTEPLAEQLNPSCSLVICSKGVELSSGLLLHDVLGETLPKRHILALSGPSFAIETARGLPTSTLLACKDLRVAEDLSALLSSATFRPYTSEDVVGCLLGGAVKNVLAIGAGVIIGRGYGENARAAFITRGIAEMRRIAKACGARRTTMSGLAGCGDLVLTCMSVKSRSQSLGYRLGRGESLKDILASRRTVAEGVATASSLIALAKRKNVELPLCQAVYNVLYEEADIDATLHRLMTRPLTVEYL